jgi:hypothetical protein
MASRVGRVPVKFVLARRTPTGALTNGIERRTATSPATTTLIKSFATGGLDAWDVNKYLNVWAGTLGGGLLGQATFPFTTTTGPQGVVIGSATIFYASPTARPYYPTYSEGATLTHEVGHYLYFWHAFGDANACNNNDFRIQAGWPLPTGAGPEGDDTPAEGAAPNGVTVIYGNPSMAYTDGCSPTPPGIMYGNFMNYFDDRALFMFSDGQRKRAEGCIDAYRPGLKTSDGATPPSPISDAYLVNVTPRGLPERVSYVENNAPMRATVRNLGTSNLTSVTVNVSVGGGAPVATTFPLNLAAGSDTILALPSLTVGAAGTYGIVAYVTMPGTDAFLHNDTLISFVNVAPTTVAVSPATPFTEDFSSTTFPNPAKFRIFNPNGGTATWTRSLTSGATSAGSATVQNYNIDQPGTLDDLISLPLNFAANDSGLLSFRVAYARYHEAGVVDSTDPSGWDGLEVYVSGDGGINYQLAYKKTGNYLQTAPAATLAAFAPLPSQPGLWRNETVNLSPYLQAGRTMLIRFRNTNAFGQNLYLDDIGVTAAVKPQVELQNVSIDNLGDFTCNTSVTPSITVKNIGVQTINNFRLTYFMDNTAAVTSTVTTTIAPGQTATVPIAAIPVSPGTHTLTVIANLPNGVADPNRLNDTLRKLFVVFPTVTAPLVESFETPGTGINGLPNGWAVLNPDAGRTWTRTTTAVRKINSSDSASIFVRNFGYTGSNQRDEIYTPKIAVSNADSVYVKFDYAAATLNYPGATAIPGDTLEIFVTTDCGVTLRSVYKKWGTDLQTLRAPNDPTTTEFSPSFNNFWRTDSVYLSPLVGSSSTFQLVFRNTHNAPGNNIFLDNINVFGEVLPAVLKQQGYLISPTAFNTQFNLRFFDTPNNLTGVNVYNSIGQLVWSKQYSRTADRQMSIDLAGKASGMYFVELRYTDGNRNIVQKVVKY